VSAPLLLAVDASTVDLIDDDRDFAEACARHGLNPQTLPWGATVPVGALVVIRRKRHIRLPEALSDNSSR
jgi:hypothetical protein